jgi:glycerol-3-phosphate dehydrogenase
MIWTHGWRDRIWSQLDQEWDVIIIGGGITGAGILRLASDVNLSVLLVEAQDFASGTSSRSSKLVHGGLRYLKNAQFKMTLESVSEREYLLKQGRGLVTQLGFLYASLKGDKMPGWMFGLGLDIYDIMARQWLHRSYDAIDMRELCPPLTHPDLKGGYRYFDAQTDDARLVLRLLRESVEDGGLALNYARVDGLLRSQAGQVCGVQLRDTSGGIVRTAEVRAKVVINATGAWADALRGQIGRKARLRPLRGSHLVLPFERLPVTRSISFLHPEDGRPVFVLPWEGSIIFGTTDIDHKTGPVTNPAISNSEYEYLLKALQHIFPEQGLDEADVIATYSGLRPVVDTGKADPSKESREYAIWDEDGLITVSGGKLTTFRLVARAALKVARKHLGDLNFNPDTPVLKAIPTEAVALLNLDAFTPGQRLRLLGRYGVQSTETLAASNKTDRQRIGQTPYIWAELRQAACCEGVVHLDDLLLRRVRLGLLLPNGGLDLLPQIRPIVQAGLGWDDTRWEQETVAYAQLWQASYCGKP